MKKIIFACAVLLSGCHSGRHDAGSASGRRIVCLSKQYTEIIFALGAENDIVATDQSSTWPAEAAKLPKVGYHRALSLEPIVAQKPDVVIHDNNIGPAHVISQLEQLKIPMHAFGKYSNTIAGTDSLIREIGRYFSKERQADSVCALLDSDMTRALAVRDTVRRPRIAVIHYGQASNVYLTMTNLSTAAKLVEWAGGVMAVNGEKGMIPLSAEVLAQADPDIILFTDYGFDRLGSPENARQLPGIAQTRAAKSGKVFRVEEHDLVYLGPRTGKNIMSLSAIIHGVE